MNELSGFHVSPVAAFSSPLQGFGKRVALGFLQSPNIIVRILSIIQRKLVEAWLSASNLIG